jgi:hypothetical protein
MKFLLKNGTLYADGMFLCFAEVNHGSSDLQPGRYALSTSYSHAHGRDLVLAADGGWIGGEPECAIILCTVRGRGEPIPCRNAERRLFALVETDEERGRSCSLVIE